MAPTRAWLNLRRGMPSASDHARAHVGVRTEPLTGKFSMVKSRLVMTFNADDGGRKSVFNETGDRMTLSVTITSERLTSG